MAVISLNGIPAVINTVVSR